MLLVLPREAQGWAFPVPSQQEDLPRHPPQIHDSSTGEHTDHVCHITVQPNVVPALPKPLSLSSEGFEWELTALLFNLIMGPALLFVFGTQILGDRGTTTFAFTKAFSALHLALVDGCPASAGCLRSKKSAGFFQHDPLSGWQLFLFISFAPQGAATCAMSPSYLPVPPAQPSHQGWSKCPSVLYV